MVTRMTDQKQWGLMKDELVPRALSSSDKLTWNE